MQSPIEQKIEALVAPSIEAEGFNIVRVRYSGETLQVMAERANGEDVNVDECAIVSRIISSIMDVEDPISEAYTLEVSSAGIDRPLTKLEHFERYVGALVKFQVALPVLERKKFKAFIEGALEEEIHVTFEDIKGDEAKQSIAFSNIQSAKLDINDQLKKAS